MHLMGLRDRATCLNEPLWTNSHLQTTSLIMCIRMAENWRLSI